MSYRHWADGLRLAREASFNCRAFKGRAFEAALHLRLSSSSLELEEFGEPLPPLGGRDPEAPPILENLLNGLRCTCSVHVVYM